MTLDLQILGINNSTTIPLDKVEGEQTSELDIRYALGREAEPQGRRRTHSHAKYGEINEDDFGNPRNITLNGQRRLNVDFSDLPEEDLIIDYLPVKFEKNFTPSKNQAFFEDVTSTEPKKYRASIPLILTSGGESTILYSHPVNVLS